MKIFCYCLMGCAVILGSSLAACSATSSVKTAATTDVDSSSLDGQIGDGSGKNADSLDLSADATPIADGAACAEGAVECFNNSVVKGCVDGKWQMSQQCAGAQVCQDGACVTLADCTPGTTKCDGYSIQQTCAADGKSWVPTKCKAPQQCAAGTCKSVVCTPFIPTCTAAGAFHTCLEDGSGYGPESSCKTGAMCMGGQCISLCESNLKIASNVGCEYWSVDLDNSPDTMSAMLNKQGLTPDMIPHSIIISNPGVLDATLTFEVMVGCADGNACVPESTCGGKNTVCQTPVGLYDLPVTDTSVPAQTTKEFKMPVMNVDGSGITPKAIHVKSTQPVVAFQFNPFNSEGAASNDGSLLLPMNVLGKTYFGVCQPSTPDLNIPGLPNISQKAYITVVAVSTGTTEVQVYPKAVVKANPSKGVPPSGSADLKPNQVYVFELKQFDVLNLQDGSTFSIGAAIPSLTGTRIDATKPVAVFSGHEETVIGPKDAPPPSGGGTDGGDGCCAEHIEEQMMPLEAWGNSALCCKSKPRGGEVDDWVITAGDDNVTLKTIPSIAGIDGVVLKKAGDSIEVQTPLSFQLQGTGRIQVVQFLVSAGYTDQNIGDPTMMIVPPSKQYRADYVIQTADGYGTNWTSVVRPAGVAVVADGVQIPDTDFAPVGDGTWELAYHTVQKGSHTFESKKAFGLMVYGYGNKTAYGYPGGMNLQW